MRNEIQTATGVVFVDDEKIVNAVNKVSRDHTLDDGKENMRAITQAAKGVRMPLLVDMSIPARQTGECQKFYASDEFAAVVTAVGLLTPSMLSRIIGNIVIGMSSSGVPMRLFNKRADAVAWLMAYRAG